MSAISLSRTVLTAVLAAAIAVTGAGCGQSDPGDDTHPQRVPASNGPTTSPGTSSSAPAEEESRMRIQITIGEQRFGATFGESAATWSLSCP